MSISSSASVAQLDACPTGHREAAGLTPAGSTTFFVDPQHSFIETGHETFLRIFSPADSRMAVFSFWRKYVHTTGYPLRELSLLS